MAGGVIYLDIDDEITSAAARIRSVEGSRVAVVLPGGSRVATSRINFRLLARDAMTNGKRLSVVAGDAATRALAASAGLPIFATVGEYESSLEDGGEDAAGGSTAGVAAAAAAGAGAGGAAGIGDDRGFGDDLGLLDSDTVATPVPSARTRGRRPRGDAAVGDATRGAAAAAGAAGLGAAAAGAATAATTSTVGTGAIPATAVPDAVEPRRAGRTPAAIPAARVVADTPAADAQRPRTPPPGPGARLARPAIGRTPVLMGLAVLALALIVGGAGAFLFLPTATAVVTPRQQSIGPVSVRITASTDATQPDAENLVVPARLIPVPVEAADNFPATGKRVEAANAKGAVRFDNLDPTSSNSIPKGSIVSTSSGVRFQTDSKVNIKRAQLVGLQIVPSHATVNVTAVDPGPDGNVEPNTITTVPRGEEPFFLKVNNPDATTGGTRTEFKRIKQEDVDKATAALTASLAAAFDAQLADPNLTGDASTVFPETKVLGAPVYSVDLATLVGQEVDAFDLSATASGTVVAVDTAPVQTVAEARIASSVDPGFALIDGSGQFEPAPAEIVAGIITFPAVVTAREVLVLDTAAIKAEIMGKPIDQARQILGTYGESQLTVWPDWVGTVPTLDSRVEVTTSEAASP
ncbi:MAG: hypothetical protein QOD78_1776 [Chloroflexota bacterium]|nr:hypothetical protein [Chloroflexota bacterium]